MVSPVPFLATLLAQAGSGSSGFDDSGGGGGFGGGDGGGFDDGGVGSSPGGDAYPGESFFPGGGYYPGGTGGYYSTDDTYVPGGGLESEPAILIFVTVLIFVLFMIGRGRWPGRRDVDRTETVEDQPANEPRPARKRAARSTRQEHSGAAAKAREQQVRLAAADAAQDDGAFDADAVVSAARDLFVATQKAWDSGDRSALRRLLGQDLFAEWHRRLEDFDAKGWHSRVVVEGTPVVRLVRLINRTAAKDDRVVVLVACDIRSWVVTDDGRKLYRDGHDGPEVALEQYWVLGRRDGRWILISIEEQAEGRHHLHDELVARPSDDPALAGQTRTELAVADAAGPATEVAKLTSTGFSEDARAAALDLSLIDDRFSPDVLSVAVEAVVHAWTEAIDGDDAALQERAEPAAVEALLYGGDATRTVRTVVRGLHVEKVAIVQLDGQGSPPMMTAAVAYRGARYREHRDTQEVIDGSRDRVVSRREHWTFALTDDREVPWTLLHVHVGL